MPCKATIYRIFIASPSDVVIERKAITDVINDWNAVNSISYKVTLEPVSWETHATPEMGMRPQAIINKQLVENSDVLVGVFWTRIGTPTGEAESGTVEEIEKFIKDGKPVLLYFSSVPVVPDNIDLDQYKQVRELKQRYEKQGLISSYKSRNEFRKKLNWHITNTVNHLNGQYFKDEYSLAVNLNKLSITDLDLVASVMGVSPDEAKAMLINALESAEQKGEG